MVSAFNGVDMNKKDLFLGLSMLALVGCKNSFCDRSAAAAADCDVEVSDSDVDECKEDIAACSSDDNALLNDYLDCMEGAGLMECSTEDSSASKQEMAEAMDAFFACSEPLAGLSSECTAGTGSIGDDTGT
jgi:hypothetical protein